MLSNSYDKMKFANEREDKRLRRSLKQIAKAHTDRLQTLHKDKCQVVAELRAHRVREVRNHVRESLRMEQDIQKQRIKHANKHIMHSENNKLKQNQDGRGFSKLNVSNKDDELPYKRESRHDRKSNYNYMSDESDNEDGGQTIGARKPKPVYIPPKHNFTVLYYPTSFMRRSKPNGYTLVPLPNINANMSDLKVIDPAYGRTSLEQIPKKHLPSYVHEIAKLQDEHFDQFTDGSMALEMRRFQQIQRERMPPLAGHLPVRMRYTYNFDAESHLQNIRKKLLLTESEDAAAAFRKQRALGVLDPKKARHYVPKSAQGEEATNRQIARENQKLDKLKKANQAVQYKETLSRVDSFLGMPARGQQLVHQERLTREETLMLKHLNMDPNFASFTGVGSKRLPPLRRAETRA